MNPAAVLNRPSNAETSRVSKPAAPQPAERAPRNSRAESVRPKRFDHALDRARKPAEKETQAEAPEAKPTDATESKSAEAPQSVDDATESAVPTAKSSAKANTQSVDEEVDSAPEEATDAAVDTALPLPEVVQAIDTEAGSPDDAPAKPEAEESADADPNLAAMTAMADAATPLAETADEVLLPESDGTGDTSIAAGGQSKAPAGATPVDKAGATSKAETPTTETQAAAARPKADHVATPQAGSPDSAAVPPPIDATPEASHDAHAKAHASSLDAPSQFTTLLDAGTNAPAHKSDANPPQLTLSLPPEQRFAADNIDKIVTSVRTEIMPKGGGSMQLRLDPPEMGALSVTVKMDDGGLLTASFQTSNDEATRLLSHSLGQLKQALESAGVSVDKINVKQAAPADNASSQDGRDQQQQSNQNHHDHPARQEQQRREMLQRMWRKLSIGEDPLDMVA